MNKYLYQYPMNGTFLAAEIECDTEEEAAAFIKQIPGGLLDGIWVGRVNPCDPEFPTLLPYLQQTIN